MQTKEQVMERIREMLIDIADTVLREAERLLNSGALDLETAEDGYNYIIPKIVSVVALENVAARFHLPPSMNYDDVMENLRHF